MSKHKNNNCAFLSLGCLAWSTMNVPKFQTFFSFCSLINCRLSGLELTKCMSESQHGRPWSHRFFRSSNIWVCPVCLGFFGRHLLFEILEHLPHSWIHWNINRLPAHKFQKMKTPKYEYQKCCLGQSITYVTIFTFFVTSSLKASWQPWRLWKNNLRSFFFSNPEKVSYTTANNWKINHISI